MLNSYRFYFAGLLLYVTSLAPVFCHGDQPHDAPPLSSTIPTVQETSSDLSLVQRLFVSKRSQFNN